MITISTFNIQNDIKKYSIEKTNLLLQYLKKYHIDILNLQEVYSSFDRDFSKMIHKIGYYGYGSYRFFLKRILNRINEKNPIITNYPVLFHKTYRLPLFPSLMKRVLTKVEVLMDGKKVSIYNTHIDVFHELTKKRQLKKILSILKRDSNPIILTGDFNLKTNKDIFLDFIEELKKYHIYHIDVKEKTWKPSSYHRAIDHVFLSEEFKVLEKKVITDLSTSDHYPVLVKAVWKH